MIQPGTLKLVNTHTLALRDQHPWNLPTDLFHPVYGFSSRCDGSRKPLTGPFCNRLSGTPLFLKQGTTTVPATQIRSSCQDRIADEESSHMWIPSFGNHMKFDAFAVVCKHTFPQPSTRNPKPPKPSKELPETPGRPPTCPA